MELNLPILDRLAGSRNILVAGMGGGFDVFCGLPICFTLQQRGHTVHLANYSFSDVAGFSGGIRLSSTLIGVRAEDARLVVYFPELYLAQWFAEAQQSPTTIWCFHKTGVRPLRDNYRMLVQHLDIDAILLVDGGVDSLMRGDETEPGTLIEDSVSLRAVQDLAEVPVRLLTCIGLGAEQEVTYRQVFENIAALTKAGGFLGGCALAPQMPAYQAYEAAVLAVQSQPFQDSSVINSSIVSAVRGEFGNYHLTEKTRGSRLWISPLMALYWFFELPHVAEHSLVLDVLSDSETFMDAVHAVMTHRYSLTIRKAGSIPL